MNACGEIAVIMVPVALVVASDISAALVFK
jgi:hypothetical protein